VSLAALVAVVALVVSALVLRDTSASRVTTSSGRPVEVSPRALLPWERDVEVFMAVDAPAAQVASVLQQVRQSPDVSVFAFVDRNEALREFRKLTGNNPSLSDGIDASALPESVRIVSRRCADRKPLANRLESVPGVDKIVISVSGFALSHADAKRYQHRDARWLASHRIRGRCGERLPWPWPWPWPTGPAFLPPRG
jgi:hypothetical protein